jgi:hypothetical protein
MELVDSKHILGVIVGVTLVTAIGILQSVEAVNTRNTEAPPAYSPHILQTGARETKAYQG